MNQLRHRIDQEFPEAIRIDHCGFFRPSGFTSDLPVTFNSKKPSFPHVSRVEREARKGPWAPCGLSSVPARSFDVFNDDDIHGSFSRYDFQPKLLPERGEQRAPEDSECHVASQKEEEKKLEQLNTWIDSRESAERMRRFIAAYAEKTRSRSAEKQPEYDAWIEWATLHTDRIDPFVFEKPISVLDRKRELRSW